MQVILPPIPTQVGEHEQAVLWIDPQQTAGLVQLLPEPHQFSQWAEWVEQSGGRWASDQELAQL